MLNAPRAIPHGTASGYVAHGCRCDSCREAEVQRQREWRKRHREGKVKHSPEHPCCVPVRIRGTVYPSMSIAAAALNVSPSTISRQLARQGSADGAGLGGQAPRRRVIPDNAQRCQIHGREFPSIRQAARQIGVNYSHLYRQLQSGLTPRYSQYLLSKMMQADLTKAVRA